MPTTKPLDFGLQGSVNRRVLAPAERVVLNIGAFTANTTVTPGPRLPFDRAAIIREMWVASSAIPSDADGTMLLNAIVKDITEAADDTIVVSQDLETLIVAAEKAYALTLLTEGTENELTVEAGDVLRFTLVSNSAAIDTPVNLSILIVLQYLDPLGA